MTQQAEIDRSKIFEKLLERNALRRASLLPALDVPSCYAREVRLARWQAHVARSYASTRREVLDRLQKRHGSRFGESAGGRWAIELLTRRELASSFAGEGF